MSNPFTNILANKPKRNKFDLSHEKKMSAKFGQLYPILHEEVIPGDSFRVNSQIFIRFAPLLAPVMHRIDVFTHHFFVPNRLLWDKWETFITGGDESQHTAPDDPSLNPEFPYLAILEGNKSSYAKGSLADYFGIPIPDGTLPSGATDAIHISALPFQAYQLVYQEYYRDQNLVPKNVEPLSEGNNTSSTGVLMEFQERAWAKDYFTSALPWTQKGGEAEIPLAFDPTSQTQILNSLTGNPSDGNLEASSPNGYLTSDGTLARIQPGEINAVKVNDLRKAVRLQTWLEKQARGGSRYIEQIKAHFGVNSSDSRLQRPEYLGGSKQPVQISEVLNQTGATDDSGGGSDIEFTPQGTMTGHGISAGSGGFKRTFEEHGQLISIMSVVPKRAYQQGLHRKWRKFDKFDYFWPDFAHLGEQPVYMTEIFCEHTSDSVDNFDVAFGYQQRYAEYKYAVDNVSGDFRDNLAFWHMSDIWESKPFLNETFITCRPRTDIFAVDDGTDYLWIQIYHKIDAIRPIPYFSVPEL